MLYRILSSLVGCQFAHIETLTEIAIPKKWGIVGVVTKHFDGEVQLNYTYENAVNNRLEKQGHDRTFVTSSLRWGTWEIFNKIIAHKGAKYARYYLCKTNTAPKVEYFVNGYPASASEIAIIESYDQDQVSLRQLAEGLVNNQVFPKAINFENILALKVGGQTYIKPISSSLPMVG